MSRSLAITRGMVFPLLLLTVFARVPAPAQPHPDSSFAVVLSGGMGYARYVAAINTPAGIRASIHPGGTAFIFRAMWYPDHLLRIGIETGWVRFFSYTLHGATDGRLYTSAAPMLLVFSMPISDRINLYAGAGGYFVSSKLEFDGMVRVNELSQGWMLGASYHFPLTAVLGIAAEAKWYNASQFEDATITAQAMIVWRCFTW